MYVYILLGDTYKRTPCVTLDFEKCVPCVGAYRETLVDPAQWFKVLVLGSILIDCDRRVVYWTCEENVQPIDTKNLLEHFEKQEMLFSNSSCQELDPRLDELFQTTRDIFSNLSPDVSDVDMLTKINEDIVKLTHVFILPEVRFKQKHLASVENLLQRIEKKEQENIEMLIQMNVQMKKTKEEELAKKREAFYRDKETVLKAAVNDIGFLEVLLKHTTKDVRKLENIVFAPSPFPDVDIVNVESENLMNEIEKKETIKKEIQCTIEKMKANRKPTRSFLKRPKPESATPAKLQVKILEYMKENTELENIVNDLNLSINTKIRLASIREATWLTWEEIKREGFSFGYHCMKGYKGIKMDLLTVIENPKDWLTLHDQIVNSLKDSSSEIKGEHEFCSTVKAKCKKLKDGADSGYCLVEKPSVISTPPKDKEDPRFSMCWLAGSIRKEDCEEMCKDVTEHIYKLTEHFIKEISKTSKTDVNFYRNVYICYEECLSEEIMPSLSEIYEKSFQTQCNSLSDWLKKNAKDEVDTIGQTMNKLFPNTYEEKADVPEKKKIQAFVNNLFARTFFLSGSKENSTVVDKELSEGRDTSVTKRENEADVKVTFKEFFQMIEEESNIHSLFGKLRKLTDATQFLSRKVYELRGEREHELELTADDLLDVFVLLLCELESGNLLRLYAHVNMCLSLSPDFLRGSINEYSLVTILCAFQHLLERQNLHKHVK